MKRFTEEFFDDVTAAVEEAEERTSAELVVTIHPQSGNYPRRRSRLWCRFRFCGLVVHRLQSLDSSQPDLVSAGSGLAVCVRLPWLFGLPMVASAPDDCRSTD